MIFNYLSQTPISLYCMAGVVGRGEKTNLSRIKKRPLSLSTEVDPHNIISYLKPDVLVKGGDWTVDTIIGRDVVEASGGKVISLPYIESDFSSTSKIIERIVERYGK